MDQERKQYSISINFKRIRFFIYCVLKAKNPINEKQAYLPGLPYGKPSK
ncbi:hypothetical protein ADIS_2590 [Lunatimonas lonarensis]|uniref:Uncharacterized protein n=1 Tax=Lunatimonas lonarensis TaxID=1232681 RepID=R7ZSE5_9BACT|nr:hypothetical protein ADIS_2590 [Lunatimonas lonarensis]